MSSDIPGRYDPDFARDLTITRDVERAKTLVKEAGGEDLAVVITTYAEYQAECQILAANAREIGLNAKVEVKDEPSYFRGYLEWPAGVDSWPGANLLKVATSAYLDGAPLNAGHFIDPNFDAAYAIAAASLDPTERRLALRTMQQVLYDRGGDIIPVFRNTLFAHSPRSTGWLKGARTDATNDGIARSLASVSFA